MDLRKQKLVLRPTAKKAGDDGAAAMANGSTAAAAADPWCGLLVGSVLEGGAVVQQVLQRAAEAGGGLVELLVTGQHVRVQDLQNFSGHRVYVQVSPQPACS